MVGGRPLLRRRACRGKIRRVTSRGAEQCLIKRGGLNDREGIDERLAINHFRMISKPPEDSHLLNTHSGFH